MTVTLSRERLEWLSEISGRDDFEEIDGDEIREMARSVLASLNAEPVCRTDEQELRDAENDGSGCLFTVNPVPPASERDRVRREHAGWSDATFGNVGPVGPLKHLSKEALEAAAEPGDLSEWADIQFLLWDAQRRAGISDEQITRAMAEKLEVNKTRQWPEPKDGEPWLHIKEQPAPIVPDEIEPDSNNTYDYVDGWNACRAAMLQGKTSAVEPEEVLICDLCGHDAWHQGDRTYECTEGHVFEVRAPKSGEVSCG